MDKTICKWPECETPSHSRGYCRRDYARASKVGFPAEPWLVWAPGQSGRPKGSKWASISCVWPGCESAAGARELCGRDYLRALKLGFPDRPWETWPPLKPNTPTTKCRWPECERPSFARGLCTRDYHRATKVETFDEPWLAWNLPHPCEWCDKEFRGVMPLRKFCSPECSVESYRAKNPDAAAKRERAYRMRNRDKYRMKEHRRRAQVRGTIAALFAEAEVRLVSGSDCYLCGLPIDFDLNWPDPQSPSLDHVTPLARGGTHTLDNVAMTHLRCNIRKGAKEAPRPPERTPATP